MTKSNYWLILIMLIGFTNNVIDSATVISSANLPLEARDDGDSQEDDLFSTSYVLPNQIFNDGKPYYASKDPISGQLDFSAKKPAGIETAANEVIDPKEKIVLSNTSPNIHDFLNLPVKYSSSKFVYPLVSSSYANLKYQGSNKNFITNKKPTSMAALVTPPPSLQSPNYYTIPTTKLMAVPPTAPGAAKVKPSSNAIDANNRTSTSTATSKKPQLTSTSTTSTSTQTTQKTTPSTTQFTSISTTPTGTSSITSPSPLKISQTTSSRRPLPISTTTPNTPRPTTTPTRKKFVPTKKYTPSSIPTTMATSTKMRFPNQPTLNRTTTSYKPIETTPHTTRYPTSQSPTSSASSVSSPSSTRYVTSTRQPVIFTKDPTAPPEFSPLPSSTYVPNLNPADVYQTLEHKNTEQKIEQRPSMSLADIFNSLAEEESAIALHNQGGQGFDSQGNLMQPISPAQPSPFAMQTQKPHSTRPTLGTTMLPQQHHHHQRFPPHQQKYSQDQKLIPGNQESYNNEYVSYQVQQPNVMQYRPIPGAINNVVISPGQNSASFVLGSQQQVGLPAINLGTVEKEPLFSKEPSVQYGTVINEDISTVSRPNSANSVNNYPSASTNTLQQGLSNFPQNSNIGQLPLDGSQKHYVHRPLTTISPVTAYNDAPPEAPSPYQQLPLIGNSNQGRPQQQHLIQNPPPLQNSNTIHSQKQPQAEKEINLNLANGQDTKELLVSTNIRFPANDEQLDELASGNHAEGPPSGPQINGHAQPLSLQQMQTANPVVFPKPNEEETRPNDAQFNAEPGVNDIQIQKQEVLTMNQHKQKLNFPQLPDHLTPPQHMEPPPRFPPSLPNAVSDHADSHKRPQSHRPHGPPPPFTYNEYTRKPVPGISRPNPDRALPNILPQFRPNAKISSGHPPPGYNQEQGNIRISGSGQPLKHNQPGSPQFSHRRQPMPQQKRFPINRISEYPPSEANRRIYRLPPFGGQGVQYVNRVYGRPPKPYHRPVPDSYSIERHAPAASNIDSIYKTLPQQFPMAPERLAAFEEEDLVINDPPQPMSTNIETKFPEEVKLEPVVTLQMLQSQKKSTSLPNEDTGAGEIQVPSENVESGTAKNDEIANQNGLYLVYPMTGKNTLNGPEENKDTLPAIAHVESGSEYQNTPFSVIRDQPQEPILMVKNKKPQSLQQQTKVQGLKDKFPYPIEKPDPSYTELNAPKPVPGMLIAPRIINGAYGGGTEAPIAIAYTPTEPSYAPNGQHSQKYSNVNLATAVIGEIRPGTQIEDNNDFDTRGQNFEKDFMAPFYPSVSLSSVTSAPSSGWNILPSTKDKDIYSKNKINRADIVADNSDLGYSDTTTKSFELDKFEPELQGGFKPIYPPGYKVDNDEDENLEQNESNNLPYALASRMEKPMTSSTTTTVTPLTTSTNSPSMDEVKLNSSNGQSKDKLEVTNEKLTISNLSAPLLTSTTAATIESPTPTQQKKSVFETSLEALLFGDDEDFANEDEARKKKPQAQMSGPRNVPRMGPRNLKLS